MEAAEQSTGGSGGGNGDCCSGGVVANCRATLSRQRAAQNGSGCKKQSTRGGCSGGAWQQRKMEVAENKKEKVNNQPEVAVVAKVAAAPVAWRRLPCDILAAAQNGCG